MPGKEINISEYEIEDCKGNLNKLIAEWGNVPVATGDCFSVSKGISSDEVISCLELTQQVKQSMLNLLNSTLAFLTASGVAFEETDSEIAENLYDLQS